MKARLTRGLATAWALLARPVLGKQCPDCEGTGKDKNDDECDMCQGSGSISG